MRSLDRKLLRNLGSMKGPVIAIILILACGVASFVTVLTAYRGLKGSRDTYYRRYRMADVFAPVKRAPRGLLRDLEQVPGVRRVEGRIVFDVTLDLPDLPVPASGRILSVPDRPGRIINDLHLVRGRWFEGDGTREVIVADRFARFHGLDVGDRLHVLMNNKKQALRIVGRALSPEFVYLLRGAGEIAPDPEHFTVLWTSTTFAEAVFDFEDAVNDVVALLDPDASPDAVLDAFDDLLDPYGAIGAYARKDQASHRYLSEEIKGLEGSATVTPTIFLAVAAFVLHMLMSRLVRTQREQIAVFRAFGYSTRALAFHYLKLSLLVGFVGAAIGIGVGLWFAREVLEMYRQFYDLPVLSFGVDPVAVPLGLGVSLLFAALGALSAARTAARLEPAEGMHAEAPPVYRRTLLERIGPLWRHLGFIPRMVLRRLARTKLRATLTVVGLSLATSILMLTFFSYDSMGVMIDTQYRLVERHDVHVLFHSERGRAALHEMRRIEGVRQVEPELLVPVRFENGRHERRSLITGLEPGAGLLALLDADLRRVALPEEGLLLSRKLAELMGLEVGDEVEVHVLTGRKPVFHVPVTSLVDEYLGTFAYARLDRLASWVGETGSISGVRMLVDPARATDLGRKLKEIPAVSSVAFREHQVKVLRDALESSQNIMLGVLVTFAGIIAFGVLYNAARIALAERHRELGALRVLGFTHREVAAVLAGENLLLVGLALIPGVGLGAFFSWGITKAYETDLFRFPFVLHFSTVTRTILFICAFAVLANLAVLRPLKRLDLVEVLKARE